MNTKPNDNAFPTEEINQEGEIDNLKGGLTKREYFVAMAMQGLVGSLGNYSPQILEREASFCVSFADAVINALNKTT